MANGKRKLPALLGFPLFILAIVILFVVFLPDLGAILKDRETVRTWILGWGWAASLVFVLLQALQVVIFLLPGEIVQVAGGYVFGLWPGTLLSIAGIALGSLINFAAGKILGRPFVVALFGEAKVAELERIASSGKAAAGFFLLFVIPGIPKDILCYVAGLSSLNFLGFLAISMVGRFPGIFGSAWMGSAAQSGQWGTAILILVAASALFLAGLLFRERILAALGSVLHRGTKDSPAVDEGGSDRLP